MRFLKRRLEVVIPGQLVPPLAKEAVIRRDVPVAIRLQHHHQVDATHYPMALARPVAADQLDLARREILQRRIIKDGQALRERDLGLGFLPQGLWVRLKPMEQAGKGIVRGQVKAIGFGRAPPQGR